MQHVSLYLMRSEIQIKDNPYDIFDSDESNISFIEEHSRISYHSVIDSSTPLSERAYVEIVLQASDITRIYKRDGYDVLTYLGDLGGLLDVLLVLGQILTSAIASKLFTAALISQLYRIQGYMRDFTQLYPTKELNKLSESSSSSC